MNVTKRCECNSQIPGVVPLGEQYWAIMSNPHGWLSTNGDDQGMKDDERQNIKGSPTQKGVLAVAVAECQECLLGLRLMSCSSLKMNCVICGSVWIMVNELHPLVGKLPWVCGYSRGSFKGAAAFGRQPRVSDEWNNAAAIYIWKPFSCRFPIGNEAFDFQ